MSLHLSPVLVLMGQPRPMKVCTTAQRKVWTCNAMWKEGCTALDVLIRHLQIAQHDDVEIDFDFIGAGGNPLDISGFMSITWIVAESVRRTILVTRTTTDGSFMLPTAFKGRVSLSNAVTGAFPAKTLYHELRGINSGGEQQTMLAGNFTVRDTRISDS